MTEPEYRFERGKGWYLTTQPEYDVIEHTLNNGQRVRLEGRPPEVGEYFTAAWGGPWFKEPGKLKLQEFAHSDLCFYSKADAGSVHYYNDLGLQNNGMITGWCTVVLL